MESIYLFTHIRQGDFTATDCTTASKVTLSDKGKIYFTIFFLNLFVTGTVHIFLDIYEQDKTGPGNHFTKGLWAHNSNILTIYLLQFFVWCFNGCLDM